MPRIPCHKFRKLNYPIINCKLIIISLMFAVWTFELDCFGRVIYFFFCDHATAFSVLKERGWRSKGTLARAIDELKGRQWIIVSRQGGRNQCSLYALTFQAIDECKGKLDIYPSNVASGDWKN